MANKIINTHFSDREVDCYAPIMAYLGNEGYLVNLELREGKTHSQHERARFLADSIGWARQIDDLILLRNSPLPPK